MTRMNVLKELHEAIHKPLKNQDNKITFLMQSV